MGVAQAGKSAQAPESCWRFCGMQSRFCPVHLAAQHFGWWHFQASGGLFLGFPVDLYLAWIVLWGVIPLLGFPSFSLPGTIAIFLLVDVVIMPALNPLLTLGRWWYLGEAMAAGFCLVLFTNFGPLDARSRPSLWPGSAPGYRLFRISDRAASGDYSR